MIGRKPVKTTFKNNKRPISRHMVKRGASYIALDELFEENPLSELSQKKLLVNLQMKSDYNLLKTAILSMSDGPLREYIQDHTKPELDQFCKLNHLVVNIGKFNKTDLENEIKTEIIKREVF